jgi:transcriptional regulator with XRE-family HTH domain
MQEKSEEKCSPVQRIDDLRMKLQLSWAETAAKVGLSESMLYQVKSGKKNLSDKALYRLEQAEREAEIGPRMHLKAASAFAQVQGGSSQEQQRNFEASHSRLVSPITVICEALDEIDMIKKAVDSLAAKLAKERVKYLDPEVRADFLRKRDLLEQEPPEE